MSAAPLTGLTDETCGGATDTVTTTQLDTLSPATELVTLTIGGNDLGLAELGITCGLSHLADLLAWAPCKEALGDRIQYRIDLAAGKVSALIQRIHSSTPPWRSRTSTTCATRKSR